MIRLLTSTQAYVVICLLLAVSAMLPSSIAGSVASLPHTMIRIAVSPISGQLHRLGVMIRPSEPVQLVDETQRDWQQQFFLQKQYASRLADEVRILQRQLEAFRRIASVVGDQQPRYIDANVAASLTSGGKSVLVIEKGESLGVRVGDAVVYNEFLVGRVEQVNAMTSDVRLITSEGTTFEVRIMPAEAGTGLNIDAVWIRRDEEGSGFILQVPATTTIRPGDIAHLADERWPMVANGFVVGQVTEVVADPSNPMLFRHVRIEPRMNLESLVEVYVLGQSELSEESSP